MKLEKLIESHEENNEESVWFIAMFAFIILGSLGGIGFLSYLLYAILTRTLA